MSKRYTLNPSMVHITIVAAILFSPSMSRGGTATTDAFLPAVGAPLGVGATFKLRAFSVQFLPVPSGANAATDGSSGISVVPITVFAFPLRLYAPNYLLTGPTATTRLDFCFSHSPLGIGPAGSADWDVVTGAPPLSAIATVPLGTKGAAAAQAEDPYQLAAGVYKDYSYTVDKLTLQVDPSKPTEFVGGSYFATDSRFSQPLWSLGVSAQGVLNSQSDLQVTFKSNSILGLDDTLIEDEVRAAFTVSSGTATLSSFELFDTTYKVSQTIQYSEGTNAGVGPVPEPPGVILLSSGCLAIVGAMLVQRGRSAPR
jgi:hypothetical protein